MSFASGQSIKRARDILLCQPPGIFNRQTFDHLSQGRTTGKRRRATVSEKTRGFDATIPQLEAQPQTVAANGIDFFRSYISVRQFTGVARILYVIVEGCGIGQSYTLRLAVSQARSALAFW